MGDIQQEQTQSFILTPHLCQKIKLAINKLGCCGCCDGDELADSGETWLQSRCSDMKDWERASSWAHICSLMEFRVKYILEILWKCCSCGFSLMMTCMATIPNVKVFISVDSIVTVYCGNKIMIYGMCRMIV